MPTPVGKGAISVVLSVRPSVVYIVNNSRTRRPSVHKFGMKVRHLRCDSHTSFKAKWSKVNVTRPINADTHRAPYLPNGKANELQTWYTDGGRRPASATAPWPPRSSESRKVTWSVWAVLAQCCTCVIRSRRGHTVSAEPAATLFVNLAQTRASASRSDYNVPRTNRRFTNSSFSISVPPFGIVCLAISVAHLLSHLS